jgi:hypothetical protein
VGWQRRSVAFAISLNVKRRHLTSSQSGVIALKALELIEEEAKERQRLAGGDKYNTEPHPQKIEDAVLADKGESTHIAAKLLNTNHDYVSVAKRIAENATSKPAYKLQAQEV